MRARTYVIASVLVLVFTAVAFLLTSCGDDITGSSDTGPATFSRMIGGTATDFARDAVATSDGLRVVTGSFQDTLRITGSSEFLGAAGPSDAFVAAFNPDGSLAWSQRYGGPGVEVPFAIARDANNNLYLGGSYQGDTSFGTTNLSEVGLQDILAAKLDADGNVIWAVGGGGAQQDRANDIVPTTDGGAYVCALAGEGPFSYAGLSVGEAGSESGFVTRLSPLGGAIWTRLATGPSDSEIVAAAGTSDGGLYVCGQYEGGDVTLGGTTTLTPDGGTDAYIVRYSDVGGQALVIPIGGPGVSLPKGIVAMNDGSALVGTFSGIIDLDVTSTAGQLTSIAGSEDAFIARFELNGALRWARILGGFGAEAGFAVARIGSSDLLVCGQFAGTVQFGNFSLTTNGLQDIFVLRLDEDGDVDGAVAIGSVANDPVASVTSLGESAIVVGATLGDTRFPDGSIRAGFGDYDGFIFQR